MSHPIERRAFLSGLSSLAAAGVAGFSPRSEACAPYDIFQTPVSIFAASKSGDVKLSFVPRDATEGKLYVRNLTKRPLNVELPMGFAGMPVLAQFGNGNGNGNGQAQGQTVAGGFGQRNANGNGNGNGNGNNFFMNIAPEKVDKLDLELLCLEYGKPDPRPAMAYEIKPIEAYTARKELLEFVRQFAQGGFLHGPAQAAAWHFANDMSWGELAALKVKRYATVYTPQAPTVFNANELSEARKIVDRVVAAVKEQANPSLASSRSAS